MSTSASSPERLRVGINAQITSGGAGGVEQALIGLAGGLSSLEDGDEEYYFLTRPGHSDWLKPFVSGNCHIIESSISSASPTWKSRTIARVSRITPALVRYWRTRPVTPWTKDKLPTTDGSLEQLDAHIIHFPFQSAFATNVLTIYQPWDLQHVHLPQFFTPRELQIRDTSYKAFCDLASTVVVASDWTLRDVHEHLAVDTSKIAVIPMAPPTNLYPMPTDRDLGNVKEKFGLPDHFLFFPAQTFAHKNHIGLAKALAFLKEKENLQIPLVCSGLKNHYYPTLASAIQELGIDNQVLFVGHVTPMELQSLYRLADGLVFPTLFEGWGLPVTEAFLAGIAVVCSNVTCLPEQAGDAALFFDPNSTEDMACKIRQLWTNDSLRQELIEKGTQRVQEFTWKEVALNFRALYRHHGSVPLTADDVLRLARMRQE